MKKKQAHEYKYVLTWCGIPEDGPIKPLVKYLTEISSLFRNSKARLITAKEYKKLIEDELIAPGKSYWTIKDIKGQKQVGLISLTTHKGYISSWEAISECKNNFCLGWKAAKRRQIK